MNENRWRLFSVYVLVILTSVVLIVKSRTPSIKKGAAFQRYTSSLLMVKLKESNGNDGVYRIIDNGNGFIVNNVTQGSVPVVVKSSVGSGGIYNAHHLPELHQGSFKRLSAAELMLIGAPLDVATMTADDWDSLPGIGSSLANKIMEYSQKNGGLSSLDELVVVPGVGHGRIEKLRRFFK